MGNCAGNLPYRRSRKRNPSRSEISCPLTSKFAASALRRLCSPPSRAARARSGSCSTRRRPGPSRPISPETCRGCCPPAPVRSACSSMPATIRSPPVIARVPLDMLQLHGNETPRRVAEIGGRFGIPVMTAIRVATAEDLVPLADYEAVADWILFDAKPPPNVTTLPGGTGIAFDWQLLRRVKINKPWMLSGWPQRWQSGRSRSADCRQDGRCFIRRRGCARREEHCANPGVSRRGESALTRSAVHPAAGGAQLDYRISCPYRVTRQRVVARDRQPGNAIMRQ